MKKTNLFITFLLLSLSVFAQADLIPFDKEHWDLQAAKVTEYLGRPSLSGTAYLNTPAFENGVIEFDLSVTGQRSYPGVIFRSVSAGDYERIYIRPHLPPTFQNVVQYVSAFNGIDSWQLYTGPGCIAGAEIPKNQWFHVKVEFRGSQARIFLNGAAAPSLEISHLGHGPRQGKIALYGPTDGSAWFSNFTCREDNSLLFRPARPEEVPFGTITDWQISTVYKMSEVDIERTPQAQGIDKISWQSVTCRPDGIVDISRFFPRKGTTPDVIFARTTIESTDGEAKLFSFGYCNLISIFLNGNLLFSGNSAYGSRDPSFQGVIGLNDYITLPVKKGKNELLISLTESFGGWGFIFRDAKAIYQDKSLVQKWEIRNKFRYPESVQYDRKRDLLYVSNLYNDGNEFISKISRTGEILSPEWVSGIMQPTGMIMSNDKLYVVGRYALVEIDPDKGTITNRYRFPDPGMPNDVTADDNGNLYITDSQKNLLYRFSAGKMEVWLQHDELVRPNGILYDNGRILVGTSGDGCIKVIDPASKAITTLVCLGAGSVMDGLAADGKGNYLVSDYNGLLFRINSKGEKQLLLNTTAPSRPCAAFEYIPEKNLLVIPTLEDNRVVGYEIR